MARTYKRWIFTKSTEYRPGGALRVGQILDDAFEPASALHPGGPLPVPEDVSQEDSELSGVGISQASELSAQFGLWADLSGFSTPPGASGDASTRKSHSRDWHFDKILSTIITPSNEYIDASLRHGDVPAKLKNVYLFRKRLYMITGVRVVRGARMTTSEERSASVNLSVQADASDAGVPVTAGATAGLERKVAEEMSFEEASDFVFAYRLQQIFYYGVNKDPRHKPFKHGETSAAGRPVETVLPSEEFDDFEVLNIDEDDYEGDDVPNVSQVAIPSFEGVVILVKPAEGLDVS